MLKKNIQDNLDESGQAAIEFVLTIAFGLGIVFLYVNFAFNYTVGYAVHYATFMAARTFQTVDASTQTENANFATAEAKARGVFERYRLNRFDIEMDGFKILRPEQGGKSNLFVGATTEFSKKISVFAPVGGQESATLLSEAMLGKEPMRITSYHRICRAINLTTCNKDLLVTLYDNGD